jgi:hypothetical protein
MLRNWNNSHVYSGTFFRLGSADMNPLSIFGDLKRIQTHRHDLQGVFSSHASRLQLVPCHGSGSVGKQICYAGGGTLIRYPADNKNTNKSYLTYLRKTMRDLRDLESFPSTEPGRYGAS